MITQIAPNTEYFTVLCPHHGLHGWRFEPLPDHWSAENRKRLRQAAQDQAATLCPAAGNVLTFSQLTQPLEASNNWSLRRTAAWADETETIVAAPYPHTN